MNKIVLEKLLHTYKLIDPNDKRLYEVEIDNDGKERRVFHSFAKHFARHWSFPNHINMRNLGDETDGKHWFQYFKSLANQIQQSQKFYIDLTGDKLTDTEFERIAPDVQHILPYKNCFFQFRTKANFTVTETDGVVHIEGGEVLDQYQDECIYNLIVMEDEDADVNMPDGSISKGIFHVALFPYDATDSHFLFDPNIYTLKYHDDGSFTFWLEEDTSKNPWARLVDLSADSNGQYTNRSLNEWVQSASNNLCTFFAMMSFPQITQQQKVKGVSPRVLESPAKYKFSELVRRPTWEHKTLVLDMYDRQSSGSTKGKNGKRSSGTAFHSVRKHLRRLPNGKHTFVKAHFRGSKDSGVIQKDYEVRA